MLSSDKLEDADGNAKKEDADTNKNTAEVKEKEDAEARKAEEEKRQNELEEARKAAELKEKEEAEKQAHLDVDEAIREDDEKKLQEEDDKIKKQGRGCPQKGEKKEETDSKQGDSKESEGFFTPVEAQTRRAMKQ